jgi:CNT family concentrative nucleoside transporter
MTILRTARHTRSEFCTVLAAGMATTASNVLALYVFLLQKQFPSIAGHLVSASILSAVSAVVVSKLIFPETEAPATPRGRRGVRLYEKESSLMEAIIKGPTRGRG